MPTDVSKDGANDCLTYRNIESAGSHLIYFFINSHIEPTFILRSTAHLFFFMIGASPAGFKSTSTLTLA